MITFADVENNEYQAQCEIEKTDAVNGEKSLSGTIYFGQDVKANIAKGWTLSFLNEEYVVVTYTKNDKENTVAFSAVQAFFYKMSKTSFYEKWNGSHPFATYLDALFAGTGYTYDNTASVAAFEKQDWGMSDRLSLFNDIIDQASVEFSVEGTVVHVVPAMGSDLSTIVRKKFNLDTAEIQTDNTSFATYGRGYGAYSKPNDTTSPRLEVEYKSPLYAYYYPKFGAIEAVPVADERYTIADNLLTAVKEKVDKSWAISLTLNLVDLQSVGYKYAMAKPGDYITVIDENLNFSDKVRIIKVTSDYDIRGTRTKTEVECGSLSFAEQQKTSQSTLSNVAAGKIPVPNEWLTSQVQLATNSLLAARTQINFTDQGIIAVDKSDSNKVVILNSAGIGVSTDGGQTFKSAITADGVVADRLFGNLISGITYETKDAASGYTIRLKGGAMELLKGDDLVSGINQNTSGSTFNNFEGHTLSLSQTNSSGLSTEILAIPSTSTHDSPKLSIYGKINTWLKFLDNGVIRADNVLLLGSSDETDIGFWDGSTFRNRIVASSAGVKMWGDFNLYNGSKNAVQVTRDGVRATPAYELAENYVGDIGESKTDDDKTVRVDIDPLVFDLINTDKPYQVFLTAYSDAHFWVSERGKDYFIVSSDTPDSSFGWELKGKRRGFEDQRLVDTKDTYGDLEKMEGLIPNGNQNVQSNS
ncbi:phage protein [Lacticaseibacillus paracasei NRIC 1981]|uniref:phage tail protein n=1 Tax=Lacticaseibacillus paracasei TaxID=1597 RepID=UPI0005DED04A|nr:phage tail protein [Lacticaseibacillus paracasei]GAN41587.1 phage protein [Lacticaseibacillus paracasei NRIC 1981]